MSTSLGSLTVLLGLDASSYVSGLTKAERQAQDFSRNVRRTIADVGAALGSLEIGRQFIENTKQIIAEASALNDLSDATGSSVESLSRLNNQAKIAGADFATLQNAVLKLSQGMAGADEDATKTKEALRILGITTKDPVEALQQAAVKLNTYADGVNKVGLSVALFGKQGGQFTATLKDIAELQDVGSTVTAKQAAEAEKLEQQFRRLSVEATGFKQTLLNDVVPSLLTLIQTFNDSRTAAGTFGQGLEATFSLLARSGGAAQQLKDMDTEIRKVQKSLATDFGPAKGLSELNNFINGEKLNNLFVQRDALEKQIRRSNRSKIDSDVAGVFGPKPPAPNPPVGGTAKAMKEQATEAERYLQSLERQLQATLDLSAEETALVAIYDLKQKSLSEITPQMEAQILDYARQVDASKELKKTLDDQRKAEEEAARIRANIRQETQGAQREAQQIVDSNEQIKEQIILLKEGQAALDAYTSAKLAKAAAEKDDLAASLATVGASDGLVDAIKAQGAALRDQKQLLADRSAAESYVADQKAMQEALGTFYDDAANAFLEFTSGTKSAKDAFKSFVSSVVQDLNKMALASIKDQLLGTKSGPNIFDLIPKLLGLLGTGSGGGVPGVGFSGGGNGEHFAAGGVSRGGLAMVGELGPEMVRLPAGAQVIPNHRLGGYGNEVHIVQHIAVPPGANTSSIRQAARRGGQLAATEMRRG